MVASKCSVPHLGIEGRITKDGFLVTGVRAQSSAAMAGLAKGDVILSIMGYPICSKEIWQRLLSGDNGYLQMSVLDNRRQSRVTHYCSLQEEGK